MIILQKNYSNRMYVWTTAAEIWAALSTLFDLLKSAVCIPCPVNTNFGWRLHCSSRPQQLFIGPLAIQWSPFDPVIIYWPLGWSNWLLGSISTTLRTTASEGLTDFLVFLV